MRSFALNSVVVSIVNASVHLANYVVIASIAAFFGASWQTDAFFLAFSLPAFFVSAIVSAIGSVFIPVFTECKINRPSVLGKLIGSTLIYILVGTILVSVGLGLIAVYVSSFIEIRGIAPEFQRLVIQQTLLLLPVIVIQPLTGVITAFYNSNGKFLYPPVTDAISTFVVLVVIALTRQSLEIFSVPLGFLLGALLHLVLLTLFWRGFNVSVVWTWQVESELSRSFRLSLPLILGTAALQLGAIVMRVLAAQLPEGSITILDYANRVAYGIMELLTSGVLLVILAKWSKDTLSNDATWLKEQVKKVSLIVSFIVMPVVGIVIALREPLIAFAFQRGSFNHSMTTATANVLIFFLLGIPIDAVSRIYVRLFLVWQNTRVIGGLAGIRVMITASIAYFLMHFMGLDGIALADTLAICLISLALIYLANQKLGNTFSGTSVTYLKITVSAICAGGAASLLLNSFFIVGEIKALFIGSFLGSIIYIFVAWLLRIDQVAIFFSLLEPRLNRRFSK